MVNLEMLEKEKDEIISSINGLIPRKNLVIMFTDIVGSTVYFQEHGDIEGRIMLADSQEEIQDLVECHDGDLIKTMGDGTLSMFDDSWNALDCARNLRGETYKIALHYGEVVYEKVDVYGDVVNACAKMVNACKGGEIRISGDFLYSLWEYREGVFLLRNQRGRE